MQSVINSPKPKAPWPPVFALGEQPLFSPGEQVSIGDRMPIGHYRVPLYLRGKKATVEAVMEPSAVDNEAEAYGRNAGEKRHYYRLAIAMTEVWPDYSGSINDSIRIEVYETWIERPSHE